MNKFYVLRNNKISPSTQLLTLKKSSSTKAFLFKPGQYAALSFKRNGRPTPTRCFSIVNSPSDPDLLQCSVRTKGKFTNALMGLKKGDEVKVRGSFGRFTFDQKRDKEAVFIAGGIGVAPFMSMIRYATDNNLPNKISLVYSNSTQDDVPFVEELINLQRRNSNLKMFLTISRGSIDKLSGLDVNSGRISGETLDLVTDRAYGQKSFFVCGPPAFMAAETDLLRAKGVPITRIFSESFSQGAKYKSVEKRGWPFWIYSASTAGFVLAVLSIVAADLLSNIPTSAPTPAKPVDTTKTT